MADVAWPAGALRDQFPIFDQSLYLNTCSLGALSVRAKSRLEAFLEEWLGRGAAAWYDAWLPALDELRARYARLLGAAPGEISLHPSISAALAAVAESLDYRRRPRVICTALDFPTLSYQWLARRAEGIEVHIVESPDEVSVPLESLARAIDGRTALVATSHVFFTSGVVQEVAALAELCHDREAFLLVDGYQAVGQVPVHLPTLGADFYCAGGLKWLLGGSGIALLYANADRTSGLLPRVTGWFAHREPFAFEPRRLDRRTDAGRFEAGTPAMAAVYAQLGGLDVLEAVGLPRIHAITAALTADLIDTALACGLNPRVGADPTRRSAIVAIPRADPARDVRRLAEAHIITDARPGLVRLSPYFYNINDDHRAAVELLARESKR
jgi:selenocysteine lyase/cysteine desulfurase